MLNAIIYNYKNSQSALPSNNKYKHSYKNQHLTPKLNIQTLQHPIQTPPTIQPPIQSIIQPSIQSIIQPSIQPTIQKYVDFNKNIYIISNIQGGGSKKYLDDITNHYINIPITYIKNKDVLLTTDFLPTDILFVQHLLFTDIFPEDINKIKNKYNVKTIISIHDFYWFIPNIPDIDTLLHIIDENPYYEKIYLNPPQLIHPSILTMFDNASIVIHPSLFTKTHFDMFFKKDNAIIQSHNDINIDYTTKQIPTIINNQINIGHFQAFTPCKGSEFITLFLNKYKKYKGYEINFLIIGKNIFSYNESNWYEKIIEHNLHCLLHLNKYGETYSYALSKSINSGLPILYNNIGSAKERIPTRDHYIKIFDSEHEMENHNILYTQFEKMLDYIILNQGKIDTFNSTTTIKYKDLYNYIFDDTLSPSINTILHNKIKPFAIYFPQFHVIPENNKNYYNGMTDIVNLQYFIDNYKKPNDLLDTPSLSELSISSILDYNLTNKIIIKKQIEIAKKFSIYGFACYYYWFSTNSITNQPTIFENCYDLFFKEDLDFKIYFVWANENWSNNLCFNVENEKIINIYSFDNCLKNINNLIKYFKHSNYYKIKNKPVFFIHHPWYMTIEEIGIFNYILESECLKNGFDGVLLHLNNMMDKNLNLKMYNFSPSYKGHESSDYNIYTDTIIKSQIKNNYINTMFFDFNNSARLCIPNKLQLSINFTNNTIYNQDYLVDIILNKYKEKHEEIDKIVLINSWNEWGENMAIEPGEINKTKYLSLIKSNLLSFIP